MKKRLTIAHKLAYYDVNENVKSHLIVDAKGVERGTILNQQQTAGGCSHVCYARKSLTSHRETLLPTEKEALAAEWECERFRMYLYGHEFELLTDHKTLEMIYSPKSKPSLDIESLGLRLLPFTFKVKYIPVNWNVADSLSRLIEEPTKNKI